jgi:hypothetical protein
MRLACLAGVASLCVVGATGAQAQTIYSTPGATVVAEPNVVVTQPNVVATTPPQVIAVPAPPFGPFTPQYIVTQPNVVVAPPAPAVTTATVAAPRERVIERERIIEPRRNARGKIAGQRVIERERVVVEPREQQVVTRPAEVVVEPNASAVVTTGSSTARSCYIDLRGVERCY